MQVTIELTDEQIAAIKRRTGKRTAKAAVRAALEAQAQPDPEDRAAWALRPGIARDINRSKLSGGKVFDTLQEAQAHFRKLVKQ